MKCISILIPLLTSFSAFPHSSSHEYAMTGMKDSVTLPIAQHASTSARDSVKTSRPDTVVTLKEVVVSARQNVVTTNGAVTHIRIAGTPYANLGTLADMLPMIPGFVNKGSGIEVSGNGKPVFILDGREIRNESELATISADNIKSIRIDKTPDAQYAGLVNATVQIFSKKNLNDYLFLQAINEMNVRRRLSEGPALNARAQYRGFTSTFYYDFSHSQSLIKETYFRNITDNLNTVSPLFSLNQNRELHTQGNTHYLNWMGEYTFNSHHRLGLYYHGNYDFSRLREVGNTNARLRDTLTILPFNATEKNKHGLSSFTVMYTFNKGSHRLNVTQDVAFRDTPSSKTTIEGDDSSEVAYSSHSRYKLYTTNIRYSTALPYRIGMSAGLTFNCVHSNYNLSYLSNSDNIPAYYSGSNVSEYIPQAYVALGRQFGHIYLSSGLRYEYTYRGVVNTKAIAQENNYSQHYSNLLPWMLIKYQHKSGLDLYGQYTQKSIQPSFTQINSGLIYHDPFSYQCGNPELKTAFTRDVKIGGSYRNVEANIIYTTTRNVIESVESQMQPSSPIVKQFAINFPRFTEWRYTLGYSLSIGKVDLYASGGIVQPYITVPINGIEQKRNMTTFDWDANITYQPLDWLSFYSSINYQGDREYITTFQYAAHNWKAGVNMTLLDSRLKFTIEARDILNKAHYNNLICSYNNIQWGTRGTNDLRGIRFLMSYTIFNKRIQSQTSRGNEDLIQRTY